MMNMFFHFGLEGHLFFENLVLDSPLSLILSCGILFVLSILYEAIKYYRSVRCGCESCRYHHHGGGNQNNGTSADNNCNQRGTALQSVDGGGDTMVVSCQVGRKRSKHYRLLQTGLHFLQTIIAYVLMLAVMTYNVCIFSAIIFGTALGYFIFFRAYTELEAVESCH